MSTTVAAETLHIAIYTLCRYRIDIDHFIIVKNHNLLGIFCINVVPSWNCLTLMSISTILYLFLYIKKANTNNQNDIDFNIVILCTMYSTKVYVFFFKFKTIKVLSCSQQEGLRYIILLFHKKYQYITLEINYNIKFLHF